MPSFSVDRAGFASVIQAAASALPAHPQLDIYARFLLSSGSGQVRALASDGEMRLQAWEECEITEGKMTCTVPGRLLGEISKYFSADQVHAELDGTELKITSGKSRFSVPAGSADDYPAWEQPALPFLIVDGDELAEAFRQVVPATGEHPPALSAVCLETDEDKLILVTTDRNRMAVARLACKGSASAQALLPARTAAKLARNLTGRTGIGWNSGAFCMQYRTGEVTARLIEDPYPRWRTITAKEPEYHGVTCDSKEMTRAVRMAQLASGSDNKISWTFGSGEIAVRAEREGRECTEYVPATYEGRCLTFLLGAQDVLDGLAGCDAAAELMFTEPSAPLFLRSGSFTYIMMPRREL